MAISVTNHVTTLFQTLRQSLAERLDIPGIEAFLEALESGRFAFEREQWHNVADCVNNRVRNTPAELLLRARTEQGKLIPHEPLIRAITEAGEQRVFDTAIALSAMDQAISERLFPVSINVSAMNAVDSSFWFDLHGQMQHFFGNRYDPQQMTFEITEDGGCAGIDGNMLQQMRMIGYGFAIDDLSHTDMERLDTLGPHVNMVKIDGKSLEAARRGEFSLHDFLKDIREKAQGATILAEWVKTPEEASKLRRDFSIDYVSGRDLVKDTANFGDQLRQVWSAGPNHAL